MKTLVDFLELDQKAKILHSQMMISLLLYVIAYVISNNLILSDPNVIAKNLITIYQRHVVNRISEIKLMMRCVIVSKI